MCDICQNYYQGTLPAAQLLRRGPMIIQNLISFPKIISVLDGDEQRLRLLVSL